MSKRVIARHSHAYLLLEIYALISFFYPSRPSRPSHIGLGPEHRIDTGRLQPLLRASQRYTQGRFGKALSKAT